MAFLINSSGLVTTGTSAGDLFQVASGGVNASTLLGLTGADTITVTDGATTATSMLFDLAGDKDLIQLSGGAFQNSTIKLGAGADFVSAGATTFSATTIEGGDGDDTLLISGGAAVASAVFTNSKIAVGGGADSVTISGVLSMSSSTIALGAGADTLVINKTDSGSFGSANIFGGGGADSIVISGAVSGAGVLINGDSTVDGGGADTITFDAMLSGTTIKGKGGSDVITVSGLAFSSNIEGNAGGDSIVLSGGFAGTGNFIGGGSGNDTIKVFGEVTGVSAGSIVLGGGTDSLYVSAVINDLTGLQIKGGAGADTITLTGAGQTGSFAFDAATDSNIAGYDEVLGAAGHSGSEFTISAISEAALTTGVIVDVGSAVMLSGVTTDGILGSGDFKTAQSLTARTEFIDTKTTTSGSTVFFEAASKWYLFIQGGAAGTADDILVEEGIAISGFALASAKVTIGNS